MVVFVPNGSLEELRPKCMSNLIQCRPVKVYIDLSAGIISANLSLAKATFVNVSWAKWNVIFWDFFLYFCYNIGRQINDQIMHQINTKAISMNLALNACITAHYLTWRLLIKSGNYWFYVPLISKSWWLNFLYWWLHYAA